MVASLKQTLWRIPGFIRPLGAFRTDHNPPVVKKTRKSERRVAGNRIARVEPSRLSNNIVSRTSPLLEL